MFSSRVQERRTSFIAPPPQARAEPAYTPVPETNRFPLGVARGQVAKTYIVAEAEDGLVLVDQHAAHERLVLERMRRAMANGGVASQALLLPEVVELDEPACDRLEARAEELGQFGLDLERFGPRAMLVRSTPAVLGQGGEIFALDMGEPVRIGYLAEQMIRLAGKVPGREIEISYTGLRPGEKLFEELFHEHESYEGTSHRKIFLATPRTMPWQELLAVLKRASQASLRYDEDELLRCLRELVPEFAPEAKDAEVVSIHRTRA